MTDLHAHVLPEMDDGSGSAGESLAMLRALADQGVRRVAATPHFYAAENHPEEFLRRRAAALERLQGRWEPGLPDLMLGAEVRFFDGIARAAGMERLCIEGTGLLLLEMPGVPWPERAVQEVLSLHNRTGITVVLAHVERYLRFQKPRSWDALLENGVLMQCNAGWFLHWRTRRKALRMLRSGRVHFLGSDCHGMTGRPPRFGEALEAVGEAEREILKRNLRRYLPPVKGAAT